MKAATAAQVARALGEKPPLNPQQSAVKTAVKRQDKVNRDNASKTETSYDANAMMAVNVFDSMYNRPRPIDKAKHKLVFEGLEPTQKLMKVASLEIDDTGFGESYQRSRVQGTVNDAEIMENVGSSVSEDSDDDDMDGYKSDDGGKDGYKSDDGGKDGYKSDDEGKERKSSNSCISCIRCQDLVADGVY
jgi:hypothetical protein